MKLKSLLTTLTILVISILCVPFSANADSVLKGDANGDNKINIRDAAYIAINLAKGNELDYTADYNNDGKSDIRDAASIAIDAAKKSGSDQTEVLYLVTQERANIDSAPLKINKMVN